MKKHLRVLAAVLVLCFSLLCPAASAASVKTETCKPSAAAVQTISAGKTTEQMVLVPKKRKKKYLPCFLLLKKKNKKKKKKKKK